MVDSASTSVMAELRQKTLSGRAHWCKNGLQASFTESRMYNVTLKKEIAMHAVNMKMAGNSFASCNESLSNSLTTKHSVCV